MSAPVPVLGQTSPRPRCPRGSPSPGPNIILGLPASAANQIGEPELFAVACSGGGGSPRLCPSVSNVSSDPMLSPPGLPEGPGNPTPCCLPYCGSRRDLGRSIVDAIRIRDPEMTCVQC
jgi:hypothetical protein